MRQTFLPLAVRLARVQRCLVCFDAKWITALVSEGRLSYRLLLWLNGLFSRHLRLERLLIQGDFGDVAVLTSKHELTFLLGLARPTSAVL